MIAVDWLMHHGWSKGMSCHLIETDNDFVKLDQFAVAMGLRASWRHGDHYDLTENMRNKAIQAGAKVVDKNDPDFRAWLSRRSRPHAP